MGGPGLRGEGHEGGRGEVLLEEARGQAGAGTHMYRPQGDGQPRQSPHSGGW